jgi:CheY-like chemotaxis protein
MHRDHQAGRGWLLACNQAHDFLLTEYLRQPKNPGMDGFEVLRALPGEDLPAVIFLAAYEQHVLRAFDVSCAALPFETGGRHALRGSGRSTS